MTTNTSTSGALAADRIEFGVDASRCIGCTACARLFPEIFTLEGDKAVAFATAPAGATPPGRVVGSCPSGAIHRTGDAAGPAAKIESLEVVLGWEAEWEKHRDDPEDRRERERRYGRRLEMRERHGCFALRIELPRGLPNHELLFAHGIPRHAPEYGCTVQQVGPRTLSVRARLLDPKLCFLTGKLNSFPNMLKVDYRFPEPIGTAYHRMDRDDLWVYAFRDGAVETEKRLAAVVREQLSAR